MDNKLYNKLSILEQKQYLIKRLLNAIEILVRAVCHYICDLYIVVGAGCHYICDLYIVVGAG